MQIRWVLYGFIRKERIIQIMKKNYFFALLIVISFGYAQIPAGYYNTATGTGYTLKTQLYNIIKNNTNSATSSASYGGLWTLYTQAAFRDNYYENDGTLLDVYSENPTGADAYEYSSSTQQCGNYSGEGNCYNREHTLPQSVWGSAYPMYSDAHFVLPSDGYVNGIRSNYPYGKVNNATFNSTNGSKLGQNLNSGYSAGYTGIVFEPIDEFKGDIARCLLYFATCYENLINNWTYDMFNGTSNQVFTNTFKNILLTWHNADPVSNYEIAKNNRVYQFQNNRNPYIDHPEYVASIWGNVLNTPNFDMMADVVVYPNPSSENKINVETTSEVSSIALISINGQIIQEINNPTKINNTVTLDNLSQGFYFLKISSDNQTITKKVIIN
jgi:endonuclease I